MGVLRNGKRSSEDCDHVTTYCVTEKIAGSLACHRSDVEVTSAYA